MTQLQEISLAMLPHAMAVVSEKAKSGDMEALSVIPGKTKEEIGEMKLMEVWNRFAVAMAKDFIAACNETP